MGESPGEFLTRLAETIIVSVQASTGEPLYSTEIITALCLSVLSGGACALRLAHVDHIRAIKALRPDVIVIGLTKPEIMPAKPESEVYITPTLADALALIEAGANIVALDATQRPRPNGETLEFILKGIHEASPNTLTWADCDSIESALHAEALGFDILSTTLAGYTEASLATSPKDAPDFELLKTMLAQCKTPVILEGRIWTPEQAQLGKQLGAFGIVIGSAITRPHLITQRFISNLK